MKDTVSVIIPVYNVEKYLKECIESVINQTYKNIEIIIVNDGSTDGSYEICKEYQKKDSRIKLINKKNGGLSDARNVGIVNAKGEYLTFIDSDDIISVEFIEKMSNFLQQANIDIVCCRYTRFKNLKEIKNDNNYKEIKEMNSEEFLKLVFYQHDQTLYSVSSTNKMYKRKLFENVSFPKGKLYEDVAIIGKVIKQCENVGLIDEVMYFYRISDGSITNSKFSINKLDVIEHLEKYLEEYKDNVKLKKAVDNMLFARALELLTIMKDFKYKNSDVKKKLWLLVKKNRNSIVVDKNARKIARISAVLSYFGGNVVVSLNLLYKKIKKQKNIQ